MKPWTVFSTIGNDRLTVSASSNICKSSSPSSVCSVYGLQQSILPESWRPSSRLNHQYCHRLNCFNWSECRWSSPNRKDQMRTFQTGRPETFHNKISRKMKTHKKTPPIRTFGNRCLSAIGGGNRWSRFAGWVQLSAEAAWPPRSTASATLCAQATLRLMILLYECGKFT